MPVRNYTYYDFTLSLCPECLKRVDAKIVFENGNVYMLKRCNEHGNSKCPTCYAGSSPTYGRHRTLEEVKAMLDTIVRNEKEPDVVQISGGEPTIHPQFWEIMDYAKSLPIRHLMLNTNGIKIAKDIAFAERLKTYAPDFEIYLQFDSFENSVLRELRGADLNDIREQAIANLNAVNLSTTLVVTLQKGLNDHEIGKIIDYALKQKCVRGVTLQPTQIAGRLEHFNPETDRMTLTEVRRKIMEQTDIFNPDDLLPVPCNPDALVMGYALKLDDEVFPLTRYINPNDLLDNSKNTIIYEQDSQLQDKMIELFSTGNSVEVAEENLKSIMCCLPNIDAPNLGYDNLFRIIIMQFIDAYNFDVRAIKKSCVHIVDKDNKIIPFETMNLFYRDDKKTRLEELRNEV